MTEKKDKEIEFSRLVKEHKDTIYTVCYMFSQDKDEVNDLFQDVLINLWKGYGSFRGESKLDTWIWRVSLNTCISADRKNMEADFFADNDPDNSQVRQLHSRISRLGLVDRAIVLLWLENLSYDEIGAIVGISAKNVSVKLVRIRQQLIRMNNGD